MYDRMSAPTTRTMPPRKTAPKLSKKTLESSTLGGGFVLDSAEDAVDVAVVVAVDKPRC
jgi:hypothetical protein